MIGEHRFVPSHHRAVLHLEEKLLLKTFNRVRNNFLTTLQLNKKIRFAILSYGQQVNKTFSRANKRELLSSVGKERVKNLNDRSETPGTELKRGLRKSSLAADAAADPAAAAEEDENDCGSEGTEDDAFVAAGRGLSFVDDEDI